MAFLISTQPTETETFKKGYDSYQLICLSLNQLKVDSMIQNAVVSSKHFIFLQSIKITDMYTLNDLGDARNLNGLLPHANEHL